MVSVFSYEIESMTQSQFHLDHTLENNYILCVY